METTVKNPVLMMAENGAGGGGEDEDGVPSKIQKLDLKLTDLGDGSQVLYAARFFSCSESWNYFEYLNRYLPWIRPTIRVFGRACVQPRDTCYIASQGLPALTYSGYKPTAYSWDDYPPLKDILDSVHAALPGRKFNSVLLNRYNSGNDYVGWHADYEKLYGPNPQIASVSFGCDREFLLKKRITSKTSQGGELDSEALKKKATNRKETSLLHTFHLKHGSLLLMKGYTQRDWVHSVPKRVKADSVRINLTFRLVVL